MDSRAMVEDAFERYDQVLVDMDSQGRELAQITAQYRKEVGTFKATKRAKEPKLQQYMVDAQCDADETINGLLERRLILENAMLINKEALYMLKKRLDQGRSWGVDERTADQLNGNWGI